MADTRNLAILALVATLWWSLWHHEQAVKRWRLERTSVQHKRPPLPRIKRVYDSKYGLGIDFEE